MSKFFDVYNALDNLRNDHSGDIISGINDYPLNHHHFSIRSYSNLKNEF